MHVGLFPDSGIVKMTVCRAREAENASDIMSCARRLYQQHKCCDIQLVSEENVVFNMHQLILITFSSSFQKMIEGDLTLEKKYVIPGMYLFLYSPI